MSLLRSTIPFLFLLVMVSHAQVAPPLNTTARIDDNGLATVTWNGPLNADYMDDFEDGIAEDWVFDIDGNWMVENGQLVSDWQTSGEPEYQWTSAYYGGDTVSEGVVEISLAKTGGNPNYATGIVLYNEGFYPEDTSTGYYFVVAPGNGNGDGGYNIARIIDGELYSALPWGSTDVINGGLGSFNTLSVAYHDHALSFYINGHEVWSTWDEEPLSGYLTIAGSEQAGTFPHFGSIAIEYVAVDHVDAPTLHGEPAKTKPTVAELTVPDEFARMPDEVAPAQVQRATSVAVADGGFDSETNGSRELDEFINYRIYRNDMLVGTSTETTFNESLDPDGAFEYAVTANYDEGESAASTGLALYASNYAVDETFDDGFPDNGWEIESSQDDHTWHVDDGDELGLFPTPYMLVNDEASDGLTLSERLITPPVALEGSEQVLLRYKTMFIDPETGGVGYVGYSTNGGDNWVIELRHLDSLPDTAHVLIDYSGMLVNVDTVQFCFLYEDFGADGYYWGIDDVQVYTDTADPMDVTLDMMITDGHVLPPTGGTVTYDVSLESMLDVTVPGVQFWTMVETPAGTEIGPLLNIPFTLIPYMDVDAIGLTQAVPGFAPAGVYTLSGHAGFMQGPSVGDAVGFEKTGVVRNQSGSAPSSGWAANGTLLAASDDAHSAAVVPAEFALSRAYPNPFNPETTVSVSLPYDSDVRITVHNIAGRQVATLADGRLSAGEHTLVFDASSLASGVYFIQMTVPGELNAVQKVTLLR